MPKKPLKIKYSDLYGLREEKYKFLESHDIKNTDWQELELKEPRYFFVPKDMKGEEKYGGFLSIKDIFYYFQAGATTGQDKLFIDTDKESLRIRIAMIFNKVIDDNQLDLSFQLKKSQAGKKLIENRNRVNFDDKLFKFYSYRVFDTRYLYSENKFLWRSVEELQKQFIRKNMALVMTKSLSTLFFRHIFITENIGDYSFISDKTREVNYYFPFNLYESINKKPIFKSQARLDLASVQKELDEYSEDKKSNIKTEIIQKLSDVYKKRITPEDVFYYIYAVLYSPIYRKKYNEFLKIDFPRIPFAKNAELFMKLVKLGEELINLHLLKSEKLENLSAKFPITGDSRVKKRQYDEKSGRIYINNTQYFEGVAPEIWNYYIGGYQVLDKWLKDRIDKVLSAEDVNHFLKVITALKLTVEPQKEIDKLYPEVEKNL
ncbi:hypothetical protein AUJ30_00995 [Candidatus Wolfebacteria bacterium CG1_02_39_135]|uniref:Type ISP restriction-modification enzyme LLaBIII C-terminal specificity domain-containing protein n=3 Tax=Candidatus Wolfeibacteriota TaxID=1752735 RepID=A0A1J4Y2F8_9BACT|nr:hypothetical protein [Candidatus Wolfebacteria bacterium]OIO65422.1 MAG: hypothetical protein AUJ30_00995 [Candidatus Wolfebacteria bacterium CG1_02_39_135]